MINRLINHVPKPIKDGAFKIFKDKIMGLYNRVTGSTANQAPEPPQAENPNHLNQ